MVQGEGRLQWKDGAGHRALGHQVNGQQPLLRGRRPWDGHGCGMENTGNGQIACKKWEILAAGELVDDPIPKD